MILMENNPAISLDAYRKKLTTHEVLTTHELADILQVTDDDVYEMVLQGEIEYKCVGRHIRFYRKTVLEWLSNHAC
ncbi:MAG: helix-turn-helix domain-containing protein [Sporomusaceae bacterium]|nr:helix-turn-helix domain-containing protein [Sporomusaceae bacterium]